MTVSPFLTSSAYFLIYCCFYTATPDVDFDASPMNVTIPANMIVGPLSQMITIDIFEDTILEFDESFVVAFAPVRPPGIMFDAMLSSTTITILDDGKQSVVFPHSVLS